MCWPAAGCIFIMCILWVASGGNVKFIKNLAKRCVSRMPVGPSADKIGNNWL